MKIIENIQRAEGNSIFLHINKRYSRVLSFRFISGRLYWRVLIRLAMYLLLLSAAYIFLYPFLYIIITSLKSNSDLYDITVGWVPRKLVFQNYLIASQLLEYWNSLKNSFVLAVLGTIGHLFSCSLAGYGFARYNFKGKTLLFILVITVMIVPIQTLIVPLYITFANFQWLDSYLPVLVPTFFGFGLRGALFIFIFRQFYLSLPKELEESARIDGCGFLKTYWRIVFPVARSVMLVVTVLSTIWHWNDFYEPVIYIIRNKHLTPLPAMINTFIYVLSSPEYDILLEKLGLDRSEFLLNNATLMAGATLIITPVLIFFSFIQKKFMQGIERTGIVE